MAVTVEVVQDALKQVIDPNTQIDLVAGKCIRNLQVAEGDVSFDIVLAYPAKSQFDLIRGLAMSAVSAIPGVSKVNINITSNIVAHAVQRGVKLLPGV